MTDWDGGKLGGGNPIYTLGNFESDFNRIVIHRVFYTYLFV